MENHTIKEFENQGSSESESFVDETFWGTAISMLTIGGGREKEDMRVEKRGVEIRCQKG